MCAFYTRNLRAPDPLVATCEAADGGQPGSRTQVLAGGTGQGTGQVAAVRAPADVRGAGRVSAALWAACRTALISWLSGAHTGLERATCVSPQKVAIA